MVTITITLSSILVLGPIFSLRPHMGSGGRAAAFEDLITAEGKGFDS